LVTLKPKVHLGRNKNPTTLLQATGIPHITVIVEELFKLTQDVESTKQLLLQTIHELPAVLKEMIFTNLSINGAIPVTRDEIGVMIAEFGNRMIQEWRSTQVGAAGTSTTDTSVEMQARTDSFASFTWGSRFHPVPITFRWPIK
jgi:hypothetical protein